MLCYKMEHTKALIIRTWIYLPRTSLRAVDLEFNSYTVTYELVYRTSYLGLHTVVMVVVNCRSVLQLAKLGALSFDFHCYFF